MASKATVNCHPPPSHLWFPLPHQSTPLTNFQHHFQPLSHTLRYHWNLLWPTTPQGLHHQRQANHSHLEISSQSPQPSSTRNSSRAHFQPFSSHRWSDSPHPQWLWHKDHPDHGQIELWYICCLHSPISAFFRGLSTAMATNIPFHNTTPPQIHPTVGNVVSSP